MCSLLLLLASSTCLLSPLLLLLLSETSAWPYGNDPTLGFLPLPLNSSNFDIQRPYDLPVNERYSFVDCVHKLWVYNSDKPHSPTSLTAPRTEIRILGYDYTSGVWQFEAYGYVPNGTTGVCIMQAFGGGYGHATTLMLSVYDGVLTYYKSIVVVADDIYHRWFRLNVIHDVGERKVTVYVDGELKLEAADHGGVSHYFKCGVYAQADDSYYMESRWKDIRVLRKCD